MKGGGNKGGEREKVKRKGQGTWERGGRGRAEEKKQGREREGKTWPMRRQEK